MTLTEANKPQTGKNSVLASGFQLFSTRHWLVGKNLTGANAREGLNADIVSSILGKYIAFGVFVILFYWESVHLYMLINMTFSGISLVKKLWDHPYKKSEENNSKQVFRSSFDLSDLGLLIVV